MFLSAADFKISKDRFPTNARTQGSDWLERNPEHLHWVDPYCVYNLSWTELKQMEDIWFLGDHPSDYWTVKRVDENTQYVLHDQLYNPVQVEVDKDNKTSEVFLLGLNEGCYHATFKDQDLLKLTDKTQALMKWINKQSALNGKDLINKAKALGAVEARFES